MIVSYHGIPELESKKHNVSPLCAVHCKLSKPSQESQTTREVYKVHLEELFSYISDVSDVEVHKSNSALAFISSEHEIQC